MNIIGKNFKFSGQDDESEDLDLEDNHLMSNGINNKCRNTNEWKDEPASLYTNNAYKSEDIKAHIDYSNKVDEPAQSANNVP